MPKFQWTLRTIKTLFEERLASLSAKFDSDVKLIWAELNSNAASLFKQAAEYERRLHDLNGESGRIREAAEKSVSRELYDADMAALDERLRKAETLIAHAVTKEDFQTYKDGADRASNRAEGRTAGIGLTGTTVVQALMAIGIIVSILIGVSTLFSGTRALPVSNPVSYVPGSVGLVAPPQH